MAQLQLQMLFSSTEEKQFKIRSIKAMISDALSNSKAYQDKLIEVQKGKDELKKIELGIKSDFTADLDNLDSIKADLDLDKANMSDIALEKFKNGEKLIVKDKNGVQYEASFVVKFKKAEKSTAPEMGLDLD